MAGEDMLQNLMQVAQGGGQGGPGAGAPPPGGMPGGPPPGGAPPGGPAAAPGGPQPGGGPGGPPPDPKQLIIGGLTALQLGMSQMGGDETMGKVRGMIQKFVERMMKSTPQGRQGAAMGGAQQPPTPPGVGPMPGGPQV
jgi:hypothetical protein